MKIPLVKIPIVKIYEDLSPNSNEMRVKRERERENDFGFSKWWRKLCVFFFLFCAKTFLFGSELGKWVHYLRFFFDVHVIIGRRTHTHFFFFYFSFLSLVFRKEEVKDVKRKLARSAILEGVWWCDGWEEGGGDGSFSFSFSFFGETKLFS